jgi:hypothetical protein
VVSWEWTIGRDRFGRFARAARIGFVGRGIVSSQSPRLGDRIKRCGRLATSIEIQRLKPARKKGPAAGPQGLSGRNVELSS